VIKGYVGEEVNGTDIRINNWSERTLKCLKTTLERKERYG
jgi:hypothetical protein